MGNDVWLPTSHGASASLEAGDRFLARARTETAQGPRLLQQAFEAWRAALPAGPPAPGLEGSISLDARSAGGVAEALLSRLASLDGAERQAWIQRTDPGGLPASMDPVLLVLHEERFPGTPSAGEAALALGDRAWESGRGIAAHTWWQRAERHSPALAAAVGRRRVATPLPTEQRAARLLPIGSLPFEAPPARTPRGSGPASGGVSAGALAIDGERLVLQTPAAVHVLHLAAGTPSTGPTLRLRSRFRLDALLGDLDGPERPRSGVGAPLWPLEPSWARLPAPLLVVVHGRASERIPNLLMAVSLPTPDGPLPRVAWIQPAPTPAEEDAPALEFQPAPLVVGTRVLVQARRRQGGLESWCLAFDLLDGSPLWARLLARGSELRPDLGRFGGEGPPPGAAPPMATTHGQVLVDTGLGALALLDACDGRLIWTLRGRRRDALDPGWAVRAPALATPALALWAPADSDRLYRLGLTGLATGASPILSITPIAGGTHLLGGDATGSTVLGRVGTRRVASLRRRDGTRAHSVPLGPDEFFTGGFLLGQGRALVASSRGLYLLDRTRDLLLLDYQPLTAPPSDAGRGAVPARLLVGDATHAGGLVWAVGDGIVQAFRTEVE